MTTSEREPDPRDEELVAWVASHTRYGDRSPTERRAFAARLEDRLAARRARRRLVPAGVGAAAACAVALAVWLPAAPGPAPEELEPGRGFLAAAYYADGADGSLEETGEGYWPGSYRLWSEAIEASDEPGDASS